MSDEQPKPRGTHRAAAIRAAIAYRDLKRPIVATHLGVSVETVSRWQAGTSTPDLETRRQLADFCGVPRDFLEHGFSAPRPVAQPMTEDDIRDLIAVELAAAMRRDETTPGEARPESDGQAG